MIREANTFDEMKELYLASAMTWEGLDESSFEEALEICGNEGADGFVVKGKTMNDILGLTGKNAYQDDLNIFAIKDFKGLAITVGARWFDDIVANNLDREGKGYHYHDGLNMFD